MTLLLDMSVAKERNLDVVSAGLNASKFHYLDNIKYILIYFIPSVFKLSHFLSLIFS